MGQPPSSPSLLVDWYQSEMSEPNARSTYRALCEGEYAPPWWYRSSGHDVLGLLDVQQGELAVHTHAKLETEFAAAGCRQELPVCGEDDVVGAFEGVRRAVLAGL